LKKKLLNQLLLKLAPSFGYLLINFIFLTCKKRYHTHPLPNRNVIVLFWHGEILMMPKFLQFFHKGFRKFSIIISDHKDGEIIARVVKKFGLGSSRGSTSKGAIKALKNLIKLAKENYNIAITPDGPRGPRHEIVADGAIYLAQKLKMPIICCNFKASKAFRANSWDHFAVPYPFSTLDMFISAPLHIESMEPNEAKAYIQRELLRNAF
jgi:lysophospholipid acyltransferase (LPLAT)-like uncharacterized protein